MAQSTLRYIRNDSTRRPESMGDDPRMGSRMVALDQDPDPAQIAAILLGVVCDRGVGLKGGRMGAVEGPSQFREHFWRLTAPAVIARNSVLDAGDLVSAERTNETHARLGEVLDVLHERFPKARTVVVGGGHDHAYGEVLGLARWLKNVDGDNSVAVLSVDSQVHVQRHEGEAHSGTAWRRLLLEPAARLDGEGLAIWGVQRAANAEPLLAFAAAQGVRLTHLHEISADSDAATEVLLGLLEELAGQHGGLSMSVDMGAFAQQVAPGVGEPTPVGVDVAPVLAAAVAAGRLQQPTQLGIYELNPRYDRDGATARLAARIAWSYLTGLR